MKQPKLIRFMKPAASLQPEDMEFVQVQAIKSRHVSASDNIGWKRKFEVLAADAASTALVAAESEEEQLQLATMTKQVDDVQ